MVLNFSRLSALNILIVIALLAASLPAASPVLARADGAAVLYPVQTPAYQIETTPAGFDRLVLDGYASGGQPGQPVLPYRLYNLALPPDADLKTLALELVDVERQILPGTYRLESARAPQPKNQTLAPDAEAARQAAQSTGAGAELLPSGRLRRWQFARVRFSPASYDAVTGAVTLITRATLRVTYSTRVTGFSASVLSDAVMDDEASALLDNFDQAQSWYPGAGLVQPAAVADYVIITTETIKTNSTALSDFVAFKQSQGYSVRLVTESDYGTVTGPAPNGRADKIRKWLQDHYVELGIRYVLLVGSPNPAGSGAYDVPMKKCYPTPDYDTPTDYFYADLSGSWDRGNDSYPCDYLDIQSGGIDLAAEVYVGRIPVYNSSMSNLDSILRKTIAYESETDPSWRKTALLPMSFVDSISDDAYFAEQMKSAYLNSAGFSSWTLYQQGTGACPTSTNSIFESNEALRGDTLVRDRWNSAGFGLVTWSAHGDNTSAQVGYSGCWDGLLLNSTLAASLDNSRPSIVYASACDNGFPEDSANLGYSLLKTGAVATVSASRLSWYLPGDNDYSDDPTVSGLGYQFNRRIAASNDPAGKALFDAKFATDTGDPVWLMNKFDMNLYGDPSLTLLPSQPAGNPVPVLSSLSPDQSFAGNDSFTLTLTGSYFVPGSLARWDGQDLPTTYVNANQLTAWVDAARITAPGSFSVTVFNPGPGGGTSTARAFQVYSVSASCVAAADLVTGQPDTRRNDAPGSTDLIDTYPGVSRNESGPEFAYTFVPDTAGSYVARLTGMTANLDLFLLDGASKACSPGQLTAFGDNLISFDAAPGQPFYLLVDGYRGSTGQYTLTVTCATCPTQAAVTSLSPASAVSGAPGLTLTVTGAHFVPESRVRWDGNELATTFVSSTSLTAEVPAARLSDVHAASLTVANPGQPVSNAHPFAISADASQTCTPMIDLTGPARDTRRSDSFGSTRQLDTYENSAWTETGPEFAYRYTPETDRTVFVNLSSVAGLDLAILSGECNGASALKVVDGGETSFEALAGQTYYFVVDGYNGASGLYTLTVEDNVPTPADNAQLLNNRPVFNWEDTPNATGYYFQVSTTSTFRSLVLSRAVPHSIYFPTADLPKNRALFWRAIPRTGAVRGIPGPAHPFQTAYAPSTPTPVSPGSGALLRDLTPRLDWSTAALYPMDLFGRYQLQLALDPTFLAPFLDLDISNRTGSEYTLPDPLPSNTRVYWRVRAFNAAGQYSNWSTVRSFRTALAAPLLSAPANGLTLSDLHPRFEWAAPDAGASYTLQIAYNNTFRSVALTRTIRAAAFQLPANLRPGRLYYWRVRANGPNGPSAWSETGWFLTP